MSPVLAASLVGAVLAAFATWLFLSAGSILIWAAFVAWACFFHSGGNGPALRSTITSNIFGVFVGSTTALVIVSANLAASLTLPLWAAMVVAVSVFCYVQSSRLPWFASVPGTTYGYACSFAFLTQNPDKFTVQALTSVSLNNAYLVVSVSMVIGALFGYTAARLTDLLQGSAIEAGHPRHTAAER